MSNVTFGIMGGKGGNKRQTTIAVFAVSGQNEELEAMR